MVACSSQAATVFKCVGPDGKVTFTQHNCPENQSLDEWCQLRTASKRNWCVGGDGEA
ncbi:DUF4124 domain-containing protein [Pseudomonas aeruginosa]|uniref:DUF4124 domain-containing protein n=1 Tax=Pseudomonas aeruginosa TaxID=287 RepID=UPI0039E1B661